MTDSLKNAKPYVSPMSNTMGQCFNNSVSTTYDTTAKSMAFKPVDEEAYMSLASIEAKKRRKRLQWCSNCGKAGHTSKICSLPVLSCGIICFQRFQAPFSNKQLTVNEDLSCPSDNDLDYFNILRPSQDNNCLAYETAASELKYLLIRRKDSLNFVEFIRGKYDMNNLKFLYQVFTEISKDERSRLASRSFRNLWDELWSGSCEMSLRSGHEISSNEYIQAEQKFICLKAGYTACCGKHISISMLLSETCSKYDAPEWGFPKGKRNKRESDVECAQREFFEETRISSKHICLIDRLSPVSETFKGSNNIFYKHKYFIARHVSQDSTIRLNRQDTEQLAEVGDIGWFTISQALRMFRPYDVEKKTLLMRVDNVLCRLKFRAELNLS